MHTPLTRITAVPSPELSGDVQAAVDQSAAETITKKDLIVACERRLEAGREAIAARREEKERERLAAAEAGTAAEAEVEAARALLQQCQARGGPKVPYSRP